MPELWVPQASGIFGAGRCWRKSVGVLEKLAVQSHGKSGLSPGAPVSSNVDKVSVIDASARRRERFPPPEHSEFNQPSQTGRDFLSNHRKKGAAWPAVWVFLLGTLFPVARQSVATAQ